MSRTRGEILSENETKVKFNAGQYLSCYQVGLLGAEMIKKNIQGRAGGKKTNEKPVMRITLDASRAGVPTQNVVCTRP